MPESEKPSKDKCPETDPCPDVDDVDDIKNKTDSIVPLVEKFFSEPPFNALTKKEIFDIVGKLSFPNIPTEQISSETADAALDVVNETKNKTPDTEKAPGK